MLKFLRYISFALSLFTLSTPAFALTDLVQVYQQALTSDPTFQRAVAQYHADIEIMPQAIAEVLPQISANGEAATNTSNNHLNNNNQPPGNQHYNSSGYSLDATQTVFNFAVFSAISGAKASVKQALATFDAAQQDLIQRVADAYFNVLQAQDNLRYDLAEKRANYRQLVQAKEKYRVGSSTMTDVYNAQAQYDQSVSDVIGDQNAVSDAREELRAITGNFYTDLAPLRDRLPLVTPSPTDVETWVGIAEKQNFTLRAQRYAAEAAEANINVQRAGHLPTLEAEAALSRNKNDLNGLGAVDDTGSQVGLVLSLPIFEGGLVMSQTREALAQYDVAKAAEEEEYRSTIKNTRQNYNNVVSGISKINADRQFIRSAESSLQTTEESFKVGTRTIIDVLDSVSELTQAQQLHAEDQYQYLLNTISLKQAVGTLSLADLREINQWLIHSEASAKKAAYPVDEVKK
ncbi:MAG: tolC 2 [Gammaproteobacteria bacterium]|jgi:outer membrane protein|nr:tolC 2 [Gammaproteobacteria bacterium]